VHIFPHPFELFVMFLTLGFTVLVVVALVVFIRAAGTWSQQARRPAPAVRPAADRLAELDDLLRRGAISAQEHGEAGARVLGDV